MPGGAPQKGHAAWSDKSHMPTLIGSCFKFRSLESECSVHAVARCHSGHGDDGEPAVRAFRAVKGVLALVELNSFGELLELQQFAGQFGE